MLLIDLAVLFIITGLIVGVLSSLFGLGGGLTIVPVMTFYLGVSDIVPKGYVIHIAVATSLFVMIFTSLASTYTRYRSKDIRWPDTRPLGIGVLVGAIIGAIIAHLCGRRQSTT